LRGGGRYPARVISKNPTQGEEFKQAIVAKLYHF
jgi:hypothetical protein